MKATANDIRFARAVATTLRASVSRVTDGGLYFECLDAERQGAADHMAATGEWHMPTAAELDASKAAAWMLLQ